VIEGWDEGLVGMRRGGERRLVIPPELAFGSAGYLDLVPPDATVVFRVRLLEFRPSAGSS
jgi:FKBP-type peptidyl-prolyl cis-trans isomerase